MPTIFRHKVTVGSVTFNEVATKPTGAQYWNIDALEGWDSTTEVEVFVTSRGGSVDGDIMGEFTPARTRHLVVAGYILGTSEAIGEELAGLLIKDAFPRNTELTLTRHETTPKFLRVRRSGAVEIQRTMENGFRFQVPLMAPDPFKYSVNEVTSGLIGVSGFATGGRTYPRTYPLTYTAMGEGGNNSADIVNSGTADTNPRVTVYGPLPKGWRLVNETTGEDLKIDVDLASGDELYIDFSEQLVYLNDQLLAANVFGDFWKVVPGTNRIKLFGTYNVSAGFIISINSAWE